jgi:hypothetical protein
MIKPSLSRLIFLDPWWGGICWGNVLRTCSGLGVKKQRKPAYRTAGRWLFSRTIPQTPLRMVVYTGGRLTHEFTMAKFSIFVKLSIRLSFFICFFHNPVSRLTRSENFVIM